MVYIDLNMVRAGVVEHPSEWEHAGYNEIQCLPERYRCIDVPALATLLCFVDVGSLRDGLREWVELALSNGRLERQPAWTQSIAVGQREYLDALGCKLKAGHPGRMIETEGNYLFLREEPNAYLPWKMPEKYIPSWETRRLIALTASL